MSYTKSEASCDWCRKEIVDKKDVACRDCYESLESEAAELKVTVGSLREEIVRLKEDIELFHLEGGG